METNSDSDSKEDSVIEAKPSVRFHADLKKEKFKGFYLNTQKTIVCESSMDDNEETQKSNEEEGEVVDDQQFLFEEVLDELTNIPAKVKKDVNKKIFKSHEENSAGDETEDSECSGQDHPDDPDEENGTLDQPSEFNIDSEVSHVIQRSGTSEEKEENGYNDRYSEEEEDDEDQGSAGNVLEEDKLAYGSSEESDVAVSDLDYYKIRHETEFVEENQFRLKPSSITLNQSMNDRNASKRRCSIPFIKVIKPRNAEDDNDTDDEDIDCMESDFMTKEEFFEAHKTNYDLTKKQMRLVVSYSFGERSDEATDDEVTQYDSDITDDEDKIILPDGIVHSPGCKFAKDVDLNIETIDDDNDDYDKIDHSEFEKSAVTEMDDTDYTEEDLLSDIEDMEEDASKEGVIGETRTKVEKEHNQLRYSTVNTLSPRVKKTKKKRNRRQ